MHGRTTAVAVLAAAAVALGGVSAHGESRAVRDPRGDVTYVDSSDGSVSQVRARFDILRIGARYEDGSLRVRTLFQDLTRQNTWPVDPPYTWHEYTFDTDPGRPGYEYYMTDAGSENLRRSRRGFDPVVSCPGLSWRADLDREVTTLVIPRSCFRRDERRRVKVRFAVRQDGPGRTSHGDGTFAVDTWDDSVVTGFIRHG